MIKLIRSIGMFFSFGLFGVGALVLNWTVFPLAKLFFDRDKFCYFASDIIHITWKIFVFVLSGIRMIRVDVNDYEKISGVRQKVIVATHPSFIDIVILMSIIPRSTCIVKSSLINNPVLKNIVGSIFILEDEDVESLKYKTKEMIEKGFNIIIFPSGIRHRKGECPKIRKGAATIAMNAKADIVALSFYTDYDFLFINQPIHEAGEKVVTYTLDYLCEMGLEEFLTDSKNEIAVKNDITKRIYSALYE